MAFHPLTFAAQRLRMPNKNRSTYRQQMSEQASERNAWWTSTRRSCRIRNLRNRCSPRYARRPNAIGQAFHEIPRRSAQSERRCADGAAKPDALSMHVLDQHEACEYGGHLSARTEPSYVRYRLRIQSACTAQCTRLLPAEQLEGFDRRSKVDNPP
jgi:hypothetical protein